MDISVYNTKKNHLCGQLNNLSNIAQELGMEKHCTHIKNSYQRLKDSKFNLVVVGMFSRGKSTFVDAMLGRRILPTSKKPTTAVITRIIYGDSPRYILHYKDKMVNNKSLSEEEFRSLTAPKSADKKDDNQVKEMLEQQDELDKIAEAEVAYPLNICKNGVDLVDTPGMNDVNKTRIEITYKYLNQADAVIMVLAADQALSVSELEFLKERILSKKIKDVFYVINRKDTLSGPDEEAKVVEFVKNNLKQNIPVEFQKKLRIFLVSSYQALLFRRKINGDELTAKQIAKIPDDLSVTGFDEFEDSLGEFLVNEKGQSKLDTYKFQTIKEIDEMIVEIDDALQLSAHSLDTLLDKIHRLEPEFKLVRSSSEQIIKDMMMNMERYIGYIREQCNSIGDDILVTACNTVDNYQGDLDSVRIKQEINEAVAQQQKKFLDSIINYQKTTLQGELTKTQHKLKEIWVDFETQYRSSFSLPMPIESQKISVSGTSHVGISEFRGSLGAYAFGGSIGVLLAGAVFPALAIGTIAAWCFGFFDDGEGKAKLKIKKQIAEQIPGLVTKIEKNVLEIFRNQSEELVVMLNNIVEEKISVMKNVLEQLLEEKRNKEHEQEQRRHLLNKYRTELMNIRNVL